MISELKVMNEFPASHVHDIAFSSISKKMGDVFFLQIGAADGKKFDPIHPFIRRYGWKGVLVEPLKDVFNDLKKNYAGQEGLSYENVAITEENGSRAISRIPLSQIGKAGVPEWAYGASTLLPEKTRFSSENSPAALYKALTDAAVEEKVECMSLNTLLTKHNVERIDVLQIDTEGYDVKILRQLDFSVHKPTLINMEWQWLLAEERQEVVLLLRSNGYALYNCSPDLFAVKGGIEQLKVTPDHPQADSSPRFFPGILSIVRRNQIHPDGTFDSSQPPGLLAVRYRGSNTEIYGEPLLNDFIEKIDGKTDYQAIAETIGCSTDEALQLGAMLQAQYILE